MSVAEQALAQEPTMRLAPKTAPRPRFRVLRQALLALDGAALISAWGLAYSLGPAAAGGEITILFRVACVTAVSFFLLATERLYQARVCSSRLVESSRLARTAAVSAAAGLLILWVTGGPASPGTAVLGGGLSFALLSGGRGFYDAWLRAERARGRFLRQVVVIGWAEEEVGRVLELLRHHPELGYRVSGLAGRRGAALDHDVPWLGFPQDAVRAAAACGAGGVVVVQQGGPPDELNELLRDLLAHGLHVQLSSGLWRIDHRRLRVTPLAHEPFLYLEPPALSGHQLLVKRVLDLVLASAVLVLAIPLLLLAALAIKLGDGGPILFRQLRVGRQGRMFTLLKFRTMVVDAEARQGALAASNQRQGPLFKLDTDPRVTRVGRFLRATSLDELPQLLNVLHGSMSLVGPRPALPEEVAHFDDDLLDRHRVPPGVTGLWQLEARENSSFYAYRHLDLHYVENWSCALDLVVLGATLPAVMARAVRSLFRQTATSSEVR
ncbi:MAG TPA: exopolysaccharide biosynthesis polyprenyl glycosylphosphotransferase [Acidimicrobiia bacterium]|jgi:exopolysaccharide biosynthesis polyprenyl glycosylphosphotransferase